MNIPLGDWSGSDATKKLKETIKGIQQEIAGDPHRWILFFTVVYAGAATIAAWPVLKWWLK